MAKRFDHQEQLRRDHEAHSQRLADKLHPVPAAFIDPTETPTVKVAFRPDSAHEPDVQPASGVFVDARDGEPPAYEAPTLGSIVHYVCQTVGPIGFRTLPAIVFEAEQKSQFNAELLTGLAVIMPHKRGENGGVIGLRSYWAQHDEGRAIGTWHWPPRVAEKRPYNAPAIVSDEPR